MCVLWIFWLIVCKWACVCVTGISMCLLQCSCLTLQVFAGALHYFVLATWLWMAVEAFYMYHALVKVFQTYYSHFLLKSMLIAWGMSYSHFVLKSMLIAWKTIHYILHRVFEPATKKQSLTDLSQSLPLPIKCCFIIFTYTFYNIVILFLAYLSQYLIYLQLPFTYLYI